MSLNHGVPEASQDRFASRTLKISAALFVAGSVLLLLSASTAKRSSQVLWKSDAHPESGVAPPNAWFQSIDQDLAPWNGSGITYDHVNPARS